MIDQALLGKSLNVREEEIRKWKLDPNASKRIVPVPTYIREILVKGELNNNIFSNKIKPLNKDYFKTLWSRFKKQSDLT